MLKLNVYNTFKNKRVLIVYPHPDDEVFSVGGLMQKLLQMKVDFKLICLTKGEASTLKFGLSENEMLANKRSAEYKQVMNYLGVKDYHIEDFPDKKLKECLIDVRAYFLDIFKNYNPNILITYEPCGIYGHPDHIFVSKLLTDLGKILNLKIIYSTVSPKFIIPKKLLAMAEHPAKIKPIYPTHVLTLSLSELLHKIKAWKLHSSQTGNNRFRLHEVLMVFMFSKEYFYMGKQDEG